MARFSSIDGQAVAIDMFRQSFTKIARFGLVLCAPALILLAAVGIAVGVESFLLLFVVVMTSYAIYLAEAVRGALQGLQRFLWLGVAGLTWMTSRFGLAMAGLVIFGAPWAGLTGVLLSGLATCALFYAVLTRGCRPPPQYKGSLFLKTRKLVPFGASYGVFSALVFLDVFLDVLLGYLLLDRSALGIYAASAVLPKAMIVLCLPIVQVLFPVLISEHSTNSVRPVSIAKGLGLTFIVSAAGAVLMVALSDILCDGVYAVKRCQLPLLSTLAVSAVPLCLLRVFVLLQLARGRDLHPLLLIVPAAIYVAYFSGTNGGIFELARSFSIFVWTTLAFYVVACAVGVRRHKTIFAD